MVIVVLAMALTLLAAACSGPADVAATDEGRDQAPTPTPTPESPSENAPDEPKPEPRAYIPAGQPGSAAAYAELVERLEQLVPRELRSQVPWPDLRDPNPIVAQQEIFAMWIWMAANLPEPALVEVLAAPGSPSREEVAGLFGELDALNVLRTRTGDGYKAFDHTVITFASAGLPLWLAMDVPEDAVVVYYSDNSGPVTVTDRESGAFLEQEPGTTTRSWLSIMVPTEVGWQLYRDQLIDPSVGLETPSVPPPPGNSPDRPSPEV